MLEQPVRHLFEREAHVLEADLLADDIVRRGGEAVVERAHHAFEHGAVADAGVEHAHARRARMDAGDFEPDALGHHPFLAAGVDEEEIFLAAVEVARPLDGFDRDAAAEAQAADQLSVIDGEAAESGFRHADAPAITRDFLQQRLAVHVGRSFPKSPSSCHRFSAGRGFGSTAILPTNIVGRNMGYIPLYLDEILGSYRGIARLAHDAEISDTKPSRNSGRKVGRNEWAV